MPSPAVMELAADPLLIPGVYKGCDQWCEYCRVRARCLAYRCRPSGGDPRGNDPAAIRAAAMEVKECHEAEGLTPPEEITRFLAGNRRDGLASELEHDPLDQLGWTYVAIAALYLKTTGLHAQVPDLIPTRPHGPTPFETFIYYRVLIALKIGRAILSASEAARTSRPEARWDADASAKVVLVGIHRTDEALQMMAFERPHPAIDHLRHHLEQLRREVETRFPAAATLVRPGLDD